MDLMTDQCIKCNLVRFCQEIDGKPYCQSCFGWVIESASIKDQMEKTYKEFGMEDIENVNL